MAFPNIPENFSVIDAGAEVTIVPEGELDVASAGQFREVLHHLADEGYDVVVDLSSTTFVDSTTVGVFVGAKRRFDTRRGSLKLASPRQPVKRVLELTGVASVLPVD